MSAQNLVVNGVALFCKGNINQNAIVFLHGNSLSSRTFYKQFESLNCPMVLIDLPGHGKSDFAKDPENTYTFPGYVKLVVDIIKHLKLENFVLVGHSLGGHIAIGVASELKSCKGLFIFGTPPLETINSLASAFLPNPLFPLMLQGPLTSENANDLAESMLFQKEHKQEIANSILATDPNARAYFGAFVAKGVIPNEIKNIKSLSFPIAIIHGEKDTFVNKEYIDGIGFSNIWENQIHLISNAGHCPQIEQAHTMNNLLTKYYKAIVG